MTKVLKVTISGSFIATDKETESFSDVIGHIPYVEEDKALQQVRKRYAKIWLGQEKKPDGSNKYKSVGRVREVFVDSIEEEETTDEFSFIGKDIMKMTYEELQDLACAKDLQGVPLYKTGSLTTQRRVAFAEYSTKILGIPLNHRIEGFNPAKHQPIYADGDLRRSNDYVAPIEESIDREALALKQGTPVNTDSKLTFDQLKAIAKEKNIGFHPSIGYNALYDRVYKGEQAA